MAVVYSVASPNSDPGPVYCRGGAGALVTTTGSGAYVESAELRTRSFLHSDGPSLNVGVYFGFGSHDAGEKASYGTSGKVLACTLTVDQEAGKLHEVDVTAAMRGHAGEDVFVVVVNGSPALEYGPEPLAGVKAGWYRPYVGWQSGFWYDEMMSFFQIAVTLTDVDPGGGGEPGGDGFFREMFGEGLGRFMGRGMR